MNTPQPLAADLLFPALAKELENDPQLAGTLRGLFIVRVLQKGRYVRTWYILFHQDGQATPIVSRSRPTWPILPKGEELPTVMLQVEDKDLVNMATGGRSCLAVYMDGRLHVSGDLYLAIRFAKVLVDAGGVDKTLQLLRQHRVDPFPASSTKPVTPPDAVSLYRFVTSKL
ncbi:hypothetical protein IWQ62_006288 [Dispira parvispora]|uniref:SCP2 domain-containing protein n=1 Tax=Dispira parvispora TaxID=1520584 RepID=A0A9W8E3W9_9FUNG|nr:hypothetical protein IWQ62_006288 [Dispira parvispora]